MRSPSHLKSWVVSILLITPFVLLAEVALADDKRAEKIARSVTIYRDRYGVPHVYGPTDASVVFGLMYAQAEDNFWQMEEDFIRALGRSAEINGERGLASDLAFRAFEIEKLSKVEYQKADKRARALCDAFADGLN